MLIAAENGEAPRVHSLVVAASGQVCAYMWMGPTGSEPSAFHTRRPAPA